MAVPSETPRDTLVTFLPHRLNRQPVVVRGLTADELWICAGLSAAAGFALGLPLACLTPRIAQIGRESCRDRVGQVRVDLGGSRHMKETKRSYKKQSNAHSVYYQKH